MKHLFIINPHAGKYDRSHEIREKVARVMEGRGKDYEILVTQYAGHGREEVRRAAELGMADTTFINCTGLPAAGHLTSAYDIAVMSRALLAHPGIREFTTIWMDSVRDGQFQLANTNKLIRF